MAVKIVRQPAKIALLGAPTSAAALRPGHEAGPSALRSAALASQLRSAGFEVVDLGDDPVQLFQSDEQNPRTRNLPAVVKSLETLKPRIEQAVKSGALPLILGGDCSIALATVAGARRYLRNVGLIYLDRDADLHTPASTLSGSLDGMVVSHLIGRGAPELVRLWGQPPLVREPDLVLFGIARFDPAEEEWLQRSLLPRYLATDIARLGARKAAQLALEQIHAGKSDFILHFDVDVISDFPFTNYPDAGGLSLQDVREVLAVFLSQERLAAVELTGYNPENDRDGAGAKLLTALIVDALRARLENHLKNSGLQTDRIGASTAQPVGSPSVAAASKDTSPEIAQNDGPSAQTADAPAPLDSEDQTLT